MSDIDKLTPGQKPTAADKLVVAISESTGHQGRVINKSYKWPTFCEKLSRTNRDSLTTKEFLKLSETAQHKRKNTGYFVGGHFEKGARKLEALQSRSVLTLDIDRCSTDTASGIFEPFDNWLSDYEYMAYTTRSHTPEHPRVRVVIPLLAPIDPDKFDPLTRIIAQKLDPAMETVDPVSFRPAQIMYLPSTNQDAEFREKRNRGRLLDTDELLTEFGKWDSYDHLPRSPREVKPRKIARKAQDPTTKRGWIGAFCRVYTVHDVIEKFLSDIYQPGETGPDGTERYTYIKGSTTNGVVVYEDGKFVFSWHGTDPAGGRLSNPLELFRIHLFGHLDRPEDIEAAEAASDPTLLPSYKAAIKAMQEDAEVVGEYTRSQYDQEAMADDAEFDLEDEDVLAPEVNSDDNAAETKPEAKPESQKIDATAEPAKPDAWLDDLDITDKGSVKNTLHNVILILQHDKRFKGAIAYNQFTSMVVLIRRIRSKQYGHDTGPIINRGTGDLITGATLAVIRAILEGPRGETKSGWGLKVADKDLTAAIERVALDHQFHPVRAYIKRCAWDGVPRLERMLHVYWDVPDNSYHATIGKLWMVSTVARIFEPGHKVDSMLIFEGPEGIGKTFGLQRIVPFEDWTGSFDADPTDTRAVVENLQGKVFVEMGELKTLLRSESEVTKAMLSATSVRVRLAWERAPKEYRRQNTFYGTTNDAEYFRDRQGNRRYWPVKVTRAVDGDALERERDLLWAEAYEWYLWYRRVYKDRATLPLYITDESVLAYAKREQSNRIIQDEYGNLEGQVLAWLDEPVPETQAKPGYKRDDYDTEDAKDQNLVLREVACINDVMMDCLGHDNVNKSISNRTNPLRRMLGAILSSAPGWDKGGIPKCGVWGAQQVWKRKHEL